MKRIISTLKNQKLSQSDKITQHDEKLRVDTAFVCLLQADICLLQGSTIKKSEEEHLNFSKHQKLSKLIENSQS